MFSDHKFSHTQGIVNSRQAFLNMKKSDPSVHYLSTEYYEPKPYST